MGVIDLEEARARRLPVARYVSADAVGGKVRLLVAGEPIAELEPGATETWAGSLLALAAVARAQGEPR